MGPRSDVEKLKILREAERQADGIVREAESAARALVESAAASARGTAEAQRERSARLSAEYLERESAAIEAEARAFLEDARVRTREWSRRREGGIDPIVSALADIVLPP